jgi:hypothetical protein
MPADEPEERALVRELRGLGCVRSRCAELLALAEAGRALHFELDEARFADVLAAIVEASTALSASPDERFGRLRHFDAGASCAPRRSPRGSRLPIRWSARAPTSTSWCRASCSTPARARPGATSTSTARRHTRSEGLAIASLRLFEAGAFGGTREAPRCDADGLESLDVERLGFGAPGPPRQCARRPRRARAHALAARGDPAWAAGALRRRGARWLSGRCRARRFAERTHRDERALRLARGRARAALARGASARPEPLGDVWRHRALGEGADGLVPLHKLVQWLLRSLVEPLALRRRRGRGARAAHAARRLPQRGLLVDLGALRLRDASEAARPAPVTSELVVEWRALSVAICSTGSRRGSTRAGAHARSAPRRLRHGVVARRAHDRRASTRGRAAADRRRERRHGVLTGDPGRSSALVGRPLGASVPGRGRLSRRA